MAQCPSCHRTVPDGRPRCMICGALFVELPKCPACRHPNPAGLRQCQRCGEPMATAAPEDDRVECAKCHHRFAAQLPACTYCGAPAPEPTAQDLPKLREQLDDAFRKLRPPRELVGMIDRVLSLAPTDLLLLQRKALLLGLLDRAPEAVACYDRMIAVDSGSVQAWTGKASALDGLGRLDEAVPAYARSLELRPDAPTFAHQAHALNRLKRFAEARAAGEQAVRLDPGHRIAWFRLGIAANGAGDREAAVIHLRRFLSLRPDDDHPAESDLARTLLARLGAEVGEPAPAWIARALGAPPAAGSRIILCVPGAWANPAAMAAALKQDAEYDFAPPHLVPRASGRRCTVEVYDPLDDLSRSFHYASQGRFPGPVYASIARHSFVPYLVGPAGGGAEAQAMLDAGCAFLRAGAHAIKVETAGVAHLPETWEALVRADDPAARFQALVVTLVDPDTGRACTCGMHQFGRPEAACGDPALTPDQRAVLAQGFCLYSLQDGVRLRGGEHYRAEEGGARYRLRLRQEPPASADDVQHNPWGVWELEPAAG